MSLIGPRPQLVRDMVFMTNEQRKRHTAKPGLSGLAQINGRNSISWEDKMNWDIEYIEKCGFFEDIFCSKCVIIHKGRMFEPRRKYRICSFRMEVDE